MGEDCRLLTGDSVGALRGKIDPDFRSLFGRVFRESDPFVAVFHHFPLATFNVGLRGEEEQTSRIQNRWGEAKKLHSKNIRFTLQNELCQIEVIATTDEYTVMDLELNKKAIGFATNIQDVEKGFLM